MEVISIVLLLAAVTANKTRGAHLPRERRTVRRSAPEDAMLPLAVEATQAWRDNRHRDRGKDLRIVHDDALLPADMNDRKREGMNLADISPAHQDILINLAEHLQNLRTLAVRMCRVNVSAAQVATWK